MFSCPKPPHTRSRLLVGIHLQTVKRTWVTSALPHCSPMAALLVDLKSPSGCRVEMLSSQLVTDTQVFLLFPKMPWMGVYPALYRVYSSSLYMADGNLWLAIYFQY